MSTELENIDQITRYLSGEMSSIEKEEFLAWLKSAPSNQKEFDDFKKVWENIDSYSATKNIDVNHEWAEFEKTITEKVVPINKTPRAKPAFGFMKLAATILIFVVGAYFLNNYFQASTYKEFVAFDESIQTDLPDGSNVTINKNSSLLFAKHSFNKVNREVTLRGECFFDIERNKEKPFIITVNNHIVKVLGTSFFVNGTSNDSLIVLVQSGKVAVYPIGNEEATIYLKAGDRGVFKEKENRVNKSSKEDKNQFAWQTQKLSFKKKKLSKVVKKLNTLYNCNIVIKDEKLKKCRLTATFDKQPLDQVLKVLEATLGAEIERDGDQILLRGEGC